MPGADCRFRATTRPVRTEIQGVLTSRAVHLTRDGMCHAVAVHVVPNDGEPDTDSRVTSTKGPRCSSTSRNEAELRAWLQLVKGNAA
jgi:hypothetical protein